MKIILNKNIIDDNCFVADTFLNKLRGKLFRTENVLLKNCNSIHTIFLHEPIDVVFLNSNNKVIKIMECLPVRCIILPVKNAVNIIEFDAGFVKSAKINLDDILVFEE